MYGVDLHPVFVSRIDVFYSLYDSIKIDALLLLTALHNRSMDEEYTNCSFQGEKQSEYFLGLTPVGVVVYKNKTQVGKYFWLVIYTSQSCVCVWNLRIIQKIC